MNTYNGWTNYETWNLNLWIENDYGVYQLRLDHTETGDWTPARAWEFVTEALSMRILQGFVADCTSDGSELDDVMKAVNFSELADSWNEA